MAVFSGGCGGRGGEEKHRRCERDRVGLSRSVVAAVSLELVWGEGHGAGGQAIVEVCRGSLTECCPPGLGTDRVRPVFECSKRPGCHVGLQAAAGGCLPIAAETEWL